jgi:hypothetical protein
MPATFDIKEEIIVWSEQYGTKTLSDAGGLHYRINYKNGERIRLLIVLLNTLKELGADKGFFKTSLFKDTLIGQIWPPKHRVGSKKHANMTQCTLKDLDRAIIEVYGTESDYYKKNGRTRELGEEESESEKEAKETHKEIVGEQTESEPVSQPTFEKEFDPSSIKDNTAPREDAIDPEMAKLLGYEND